MGNIDRLTITAWSNSNPTDVSISYTTNWLPDNSLSLKIHPSMKMIGTEFSKIATQKQRKIKG
mgnify:CR=1 FL=1